MDSKSIQYMYNEIIVKITIKETFSNISYVCFISKNYIPCDPEYALWFSKVNNTKVVPKYHVEKKGDILTDQCPVNVKN